MPAFTLDPGDTWSFTAALTVNANASGFRNHSTTDAFHTAQLSLTLPSGISLDDFTFGGDDPYVPTWVTTSESIPEPSALAVWCLGMAIAAGCCMSRCVQRRGWSVAVSG